MHLRECKSQSALTEDSDGGCELSFSEEGLAVNLCEGIIGVRVTWGSFYSCPLSNSAVPSHDAVQHTAVILTGKTTRPIQSVSKPFIHQLRTVTRYFGYPYVPCGTVVSAHRLSASPNLPLLFQTQR